jgi:quinol monooxygenase YgiN
MADPIVFISHFRVKPGGLDGLRGLMAQVGGGMAAEKPRTLAYLAYVAPDGGRMTIVHLFSDADAMDRHFQGSDERSKQAYAFMEPESWEIYGPATERTVNGMRREATSAGVELTLQPDYLAGFLRMQPA